MFQRIRGGSLVLQADAILQSVFAGPMRLQQPR